jgi:hypothetical protein
MYRLGKWQARMEEFANSTEAKRLVEELGLLRIILEETVKQAQDEDSLLFASSKILRLVDAIAKTLATGQHLEAKLNQHLTAQQLFVIAEQVLNLAVKYIPDPVQCEKLANELGELLSASTTVAISGKSFTGTSAESFSPALSVEREVPDYGSTVSRPLETEAFPVA